jgi:hypothetical protein
MSSQQYTLLASAAQTASGNGAWIDVDGAKELQVLVDLTAGSGTLSAFSLYLESSDDGVASFEILADTVFKNTLVSSPTVAEPTAIRTDKRNIIDGAVETAIIVIPTRWTATYRVFGKKVRARWIITPTSSPSETFEVTAVGKN